jgi:hypothetical protein
MKKYKMRERGRGEGESGKIFSKPPDWWNHIFIGSSFYPVQMWPHLYWAKPPPGINVRPGHFNRTEPPPDTNVRHLYRVGRRPDALEGTFVSDGGSNRYKYPHLYPGQKYPVQMKNRPKNKCPILYWSHWNNKSLFSSLFCNLMFFRAETNTNLH